MRKLLLHLLTTGYGTTRKRLAARINSANRGKADSDAAARGGLRSTPDCRPRRAYLHLSYSYASPFGPALLVTQCHEPTSTMLYYSGHSMPFEGPLIRIREPVRHRPCPSWGQSTKRDGARRVAGCSTLHLCCASWRTGRALERSRAYRTRRAIYGYRRRAGAVSWIESVARLLADCVRELRE